MYSSGGHFKVAMAASLLASLAMSGTTVSASDSNYSPHAGTEHPTEVFWGDTHLCVQHADGSEACLPGVGRDVCMKTKQLKSMWCAWIEVKFNRYPGIYQSCRILNGFVSKDVEFANINKGRRQPG